MTQQSDTITAIMEVAGEIAQQAESLECREVPIGALAEVFDHLMRATVVLESIQPEEQLVEAGD